MSRAAYGGFARLWPAIALGVLQGLTEFLPISSSGHLVLGADLLPLTEPSLLFDVMLHVGTLLPVVLLYRRDIVDMLLGLARLAAPVRTRELWHGDRGLRLALCVVIGTIPTALMGLLLKDLFEQLFSSLFVVGITFAITGGILMLTLLRRAHWHPGAAEPADSHLSITPLRALLVGVAQGLAITPGISRSGTTITAGILLGVERVMAARLSFLLSIPAILGAAVLHMREASYAEESGLLIFLAGGAAAALSGYLALRWLVRIVRRGALHRFAYYLWPLAAAVLIFATLR